MRKNDRGDTGENDLQFSGQEFDLASAQAMVARHTLFFTPAQDSLNTRAQFLVIVRFTNIIVGPDVKALQLGFQRILGGHENKGGFIAFGPQFFRELKSVEVRHHHIEEKQIWLAPLDHLQSAARVIGGLHLIPLFGEHELNQIIRKLVVVNDKNVHSLSPRKLLLSFTCLLKIASGAGPYVGMSNAHTQRVSASETARLPFLRV